MTTTPVKRSVDFINSNLANFGTDLEYKVKLASAQSEPVWKTVIASGAPVIRVWRIERFHVKDWPAELYGKFHTGDCYIVLHRTGQAPHYTYDLHFWLGTESSIDERGTAAYKTAELDTFLGRSPTEHLELQHGESALFKSYFSHVDYLPGGVESGFRHVEPNEYVTWPTKVYTFGNVNITDDGNMVFVAEDEYSSVADLHKAACLVISIRNSRPGVSVEYV